MDLADQKAVEGLASTVLKDGHDVDILVTSAGIQRRHDAHEFPMGDWDDVSCEVVITWIVKKEY